jgi:hypothetical protein
LSVSGGGGGADAGRSASYGLFYVAARHPPRPRLALLASQVNGDQGRKMENSFSVLMPTSSRRTIASSIGRNLDVDGRLAPEDKKPTFRFPDTCHSTFDMSGGWGQAAVCRKTSAGWAG